MINDIDKMREELYEPCREKSLLGQNKDTIHVIILMSKITNRPTVYSC